ncbi:MAG: hydroxymethylglutaryl-CoA lyase [Bdellovibrionaceae bacterium]|nr:hydroxymethylglutaryl-CoA lyase [Pseudobdellovibrionaceae bacterium]
MKRAIKIVEVGPRDGLQNEKRILSPQEKIEFVNKLSQTGLKFIEFGAFVSPKWVPQMSGSDQVAQSLSQTKNKIVYSALVPNLIGLEQALKYDVKDVAIFAAASESFSKRNINCSIEESFVRFEQVMKVAKSKKIKVRGYLSTVFACPFEGVIPTKTVVKLTKKLLNIGCYEVSLGDTIGVATPKQVDALLKALKKADVPFTKIAMHFHDTRGTALANVLKSLEHGIHIFDSSLGGLGGCPYAPGALGNLATEDLVYMLEGMGHKTGLNLELLVHTHKWIQDIVGRPLNSHVGLSGSKIYFK